MLARGACVVLTLFGLFVCTGIAKEDRKDAGNEKPTIAAGAAGIRALPDDVEWLLLRPRSDEVRPPDLLNSDLRLLSRLKRLRHLDLSEAGPRAHGLDGVGGSAWDLRLTDEGLEHIARLGTLETLVLTDTPTITDRGLRALSKSLPALRSLTIRFWGGFGNRNEAKLTDLQGFPSLGALDLTGCKGEHDREWPARIAEVEGLEELTLRYCSFARDGGLAALARCSNLEKLHLGPIDDDDLDPLASGFPQLGSLLLEECRDLTEGGLARIAGDRPITDLGLRKCRRVEGLGPLAGNKALRTITAFCCTGLRDRGLAPLEGLTRLQELDLTGCSGVTDAGLAHLVGHPRLEVLVLRGHHVPHSSEHYAPCRVTDAGLRHLAGIPNLRRLDLSGIRADVWGCRMKSQGPIVIDEPCRVTDAGLKTLAKLRLEFLGLACCPGLTDSGLEHLGRMAGLRELDLRGCEGITEAGVALLRESLAGCRVLR